ncbi:hypothetical protein AB0G04_17875 [Actinoplanes sp. NPDC023801]|uniref:hypothetical protein n=1 Tax=Actinoplanes sp. NPDC023801 TaxID=3154595 RepID=UPI0034116425
MRTRLAAATAAAMLGSVVLVSGASPARADSTVPLSVKSATDLLADGVNKRLFFNDRTSGEIVALGYDGALLGKYSLPALTDLTLEPDSSALYAAVPAARKIVAINPATLELIAEYKLGDAVEPGFLTIAGGKIWFGYDESVMKGEIGTLELTAEGPVVTLALGGGNWYEAPRLAAAGGKLVAIGDREHATFDISDGTVEPLSRVASWERPFDLAVTPDGERFLAAENNAGVVVRKVSDQSVVQSLSVPTGAIAVDVAEDGTVAGAGDGWAGPELNIFAPGTGAPVRQYELSGGGDFYGGDGFFYEAVAWEPGGTRVFGIAGDSYYDRYTLRTFDQPRSNRPTLTLTGPASAPRAKALTISGTLNASVPLPAGTPVTVTRTDIESPAGRLLGTRTVDAAGKFSFTDTPAVGGRVTYKVSYAGDATHSAVSASKAVEVSRATTSLALNNNGKVYNYGATAYFSAYLGKTYKNRVVEVWADPYGGDQPRRLLKRATVNSKGYVYTSLKLYRNTSVQAVFTGDAQYANRVVTATVHAKTKVALKLNKYYKTGKIGGTTYRYYKKKADPVFTVTMPKYPYRTAYLRVDVHYRGKWRAFGDAYVGQDKYGRSFIRMESSGSAGYKFRVRGAYRKGGSGDSVNYTTYTPYQYFYISK